MSMKKIYSLVGKAIKDYKMIEEGDHILLGLSGGIDSMMLMKVLLRFQKVAPISFKITAVTVDPGFETMNVSCLSQYCEESNWPHVVTEVPISTLIVEKQQQSKPCALCSRLRRGHLHKLADEIGANKIALGQHLDDLCVSLLMSIFRGNGIKTMGPNVPADGATKRLIRPLAYVPETLVKGEAKQFDFPDIKSCDYSQLLDESGDRAFLEREIAELNKKFPDIRQKMLRSMQDIRPDYLLDTRFIEL